MNIIPLTRTTIEVRNYKTLVDVLVKKLSGPIVEFDILKNFANDKIFFAKMTFTDNNIEVYEVIDKDIVTKFFNEYGVTSFCMFKTEEDKEYAINNLLK